MVYSVGTAPKAMKNLPVPHRKYLTSMVRRYYYNRQRGQITVWSRPAVRGNLLNTSSEE